MGVARKRIYRITVPEALEDPTTGQVEDLVVRARSAPIGTFLDLVENGDLQGLDFGRVTAETVQQAQKASGAARGMMTQFANLIESWNLEEPEVDEGGRPTGQLRPVPPGPEALLALDSQLVATLITEWMQALASVSPGKATKSNGGAPPQAASLPMEPLSASPPS